MFLGDSDLSPGDAIIVPRKIAKQLCPRNTCTPIKYAL